MQLKKVMCLRCPQYDVCSHKTRMFVNYCGSRMKNVERHIKEAVSECRSKRGYLLTSELFPALPSSGDGTPIPALTLNVSR
jgi:hypothetical protein